MAGDTIAAIATSMTNSGIGIVRISGGESFSVIDRIYRSKDRKKILSQMPSHTVHYGYIYDEDKVIDEVMVLIMRAPNSYTAEDTIEIDCHGGALVMKRILETVIKYGARIAEPGEFTKRAFLNGRIDLSQAESVIEVINAKNDFALKTSVDQLQGKLKNKITRIKDKILYEIAFIESSLDDPEHISTDGYSDKLNENIIKIIIELEQLMQTAEYGTVLKEGIDTVIVGKPNAGKSSLMNVLLGRDRAIVTDIEGTTRDVLEEQINLNGISLNLVDTAGIRETNDEVEKIGVNKAKEYLSKADLIIYTVDASTEIDHNDEKILRQLKGHKVIVLLNKSDLRKKVSEKQIEDKLLSLEISFKILSVSAKEQQGFEELKSIIQEMFFSKEIKVNDQIYITNIRHKNALCSARDSLRMVQKSIEDQMPEDFYSIDLRNAYEQLGYIIGDSIGEDLVNEIFSKFCMGK